MYQEQIVTSSLKEAVLHVNNFYSYFHITATATAATTTTTITPATTSTTTTTNNNNNNFFDLTYILRRESNANTTFVAVILS